MPKILIYMAVAIAASHAAMAQDINAVNKYLKMIDDHYAEVHKVMKSDSLYLTGYVMDSILYKEQAQINGVQVKNGSTAATSGTIGDKSLTVNVTTKLSKFVFLQPTVSGNSTKDFISLFSGDKYQRTLTGGVNGVFFWKQKGIFDSSDKYYIDNVFSYIDQQPIDVSRNSIGRKIDSFYSFFQIAKPLYSAMEKERLKFDSVKTASPVEYEALKKIYELAPLLVKAKVLPASWDSNFACSVDTLVKTIQMVHTSIDWDSVYIKRTRLAQYDSVQYKAYWNSFWYFWVSGGVQLNQAINPIYDYSTGPMHLYERDEYDQFLTAQLSFNILHSNKRKNRSSWLFPTLKFSNQKMFNPDSLLSIQKQSFFVAGGDTLVLTKKSTSFYRTDVARKKTVSLELPFARYYTDHKFGIDLALSFQFVPGFDQLAGRAGIYLPINIADKVVIVEPLFNFMKLNKAHLTFLKDQVAFGFSISVSLPRFVTGN